MAKYIELKELRYKLDLIRSQRERDGQLVLAKALDIVFHIIKKVPTLNIVRCGECEYADPCREGLMCLHDKGLVGICRKEDFCSYGECSINRKGE